MLMSRDHDENNVSRRQLRFDVPKESRSLAEYSPHKMTWLSKATTGLGLLFLAHA